MACEDTGLTVALKPGELKMDLLRSDPRPLRSQNVFLNFAGCSFGQLFDEGHTVRRLKVRRVSSAKNFFGSIAAFTCSALLARRRRRFARSADRRAGGPRRGTA